MKHSHVDADSYIAKASRQEDNTYEGTQGVVDGQRNFLFITRTNTKNKVLTREL